MQAARRPAKTVAIETDEIGIVRWPILSHKMVMRKATAMLKVLMSVHFAGARHRASKRIAAHLTEERGQRVR